MPNGISPSPTSHLPTGGWTTKSPSVPQTNGSFAEALVDLFGLLEDVVDLHLEAEQDHRPALLDVVRLVEDELRGAPTPEPHDPADRGEEQRSQPPERQQVAEPSPGRRRVTEVVLRFPEQASAPPGRSSWAPSGSLPAAPGPWLTPARRVCRTRRPTRCAHTDLAGGWLRAAPGRRRGGDAEGDAPRHPQRTGSPRAQSTGSPGSPSISPPRMITASRFQPR